MADNEKEVAKIPEPPKQSPEGKSSALQGFLAVLLALLVVALVFCGVFYFLLKSNTYGLGDAFRPAFEKSPVLKLALPPTPKPADPDAPQNLTEDQLKQKYNEYRQKVNDLASQLEDAQNQVTQFQNDQKTLTDNQAALDADKQTLQSIKDEQKKLDDQKAALADMIANGDTAGFKAYFSQIDPTTAASIYKELVKVDVNLQAKTELAKPYAAMEPASAAKVLTALWNQDQETCLGVFEGLKSTAIASILQNMDATLAANITKTLSDRKLVK